MITRVFLFFLVHPLVRLQELSKGFIVFHEFSVRADLRDLAVYHHHYDITLREKPNPMSHKDTNLYIEVKQEILEVENVRCIFHSYLILKHSLWSKDIVKYVFSNMGVYSTERVIQEVDVTVLIHSPCQTHSLLLTSTQVDALKEKLRLYNIDYIFLLFH